MNDILQRFLIVVCKLSGASLYFWSVIYLVQRYVCWTRLTVWSILFVVSFSILQTNKLINNKIK